MRRSKAVILAAGLFLSVLLLCISNPLPGEADEVHRITKEELRLHLNDPGTIIIDVRVESSWRTSGEKIKGAVREDPLKDEKSWADKYPKDKNIVLYCS